MSTDVPFYRLATEFPDAIPWLLGLQTRARYQASSLTLKKEHRLDAVLIPDDPAEPRLIVEFQGFRDEDILRRIAASAALYCEKERFTGLLHLAVVFTEEAFARSLEASRFRLADGRVVRLEPQCLVLGPDLAEQILAEGRPEVVPILPLCIRSRRRIREEAARWRECIEAAVVSVPQKEVLIGLLGAFVLHRLGNMSVKELNTLLGGFMMENTQVGQELIEMGRLKGYDQGLADGLEKGIEKGFEQGLEKGLEKGVEKGLEKGLLVARTAVLQVVTRRFKKPSHRVTHLVQRLGSLEAAASALTVALEVETMEALEEALSGLADE